MVLKTWVINIILPWMMAIDETWSRRIRRRAAREVYPRTGQFTQALNRISDQIARPDCDVT
jgi:hypothetical protein